MCLTDFTNLKYIHSWLIFSTQLLNCCPHGRWNYTCVLLPLYFSLTSPPPLSEYSIYRQCVAVGGVLSRVVDHILQEFNTLFLTRLRTYKIAAPPKTKMVSKEDI
jgi:hypothetical protein